MAQASQQRDSAQRTPARQSPTHRAASLAGFAASLCLVSALLVVRVAPAAATETPALQPGSAAVPGVVIDHRPRSSGLFIGSPSIAILPNGDYVASHDLFGPQSSEHRSAVTLVFRSADRGRTWTKLAKIDGAFWSTLFVHRGALYLLGTDRHHGNVTIRRSRDGGLSWTTPADAATGLLRDGGEYHSAPTPVIEHGGRLWHAIERRDPPSGWGLHYRAGMFSAPADADLLDAANWTHSNFLASERSWNEGDMEGWLEGNAVVSREGEMLDLLRVQTRAVQEKIAIVRVAAAGDKLGFDAASGFVNFPGGAKKFSIRYDAPSGLYWALASIAAAQAPTGKPSSIRNTLALLASPDLRDWSVRCIALQHPDATRHGFQYADWQFDGSDMIAVSRTAHDDDEGGAQNYHDANFLTFHRLVDFRSNSASGRTEAPACALASVR